MVLHPVKVIGQDFTKVKKVVVPMQSMTLREIIKRFIRKESLPIEKQGMYAENMGDLEKIAKEDIYYKMERVENLKSGIAKGKKKHEEDLESKASEARAPQGPVTGASVPPQAPSPPPAPVEPAK